MFDVQAICRCCLSDRSDSLQPIFKEHILGIFKQCTGVDELSPDDGLPGMICSQCVFKCISWYSFKQLCERTESMLRTQLNIVKLPAIDESPPISDHNDDMVFHLAADKITDENVNDELQQTRELEEDDVYELVDHVKAEQVVELDEVLVEVEQEEMEEEVEEEVEETVVDEQPEQTVEKEVMQLEVIEENETEKMQCSEALGSSEVDADSDANELEDVQPDDDELISMPETAPDEQQPATSAATGSKSNSQPPHTCPICAKQLPNRRSLARHRTIHTTVGLPFKCDQCERRYKLKSSLYLHRRVHRTDCEPFVCDLCGKSFLRAHGLQSHMMSHSTELRHECDLCAKRFKTEVMMRNHRMRHDEVKPCVCDECGKGFATAAELRTHSRKHSGLKPFQCAECPSSYKTRNHLTVHQRTHSGLRPYACDLCELKFATNGVRQQHRRTHTGEKPFRCAMCDKSFRQKSTWRTHLRTHSREKEELKSE